MQTEEALKQVFATQSVEAVRNTARATIAEREGRTQEARLFRALAHAQQTHADKTLLLLRGNLPLTDESLATAKTSLDQVADHFRDMMMTAAREGAASVETTVMQFSKAAKSQAAASGRVADAEAPYAVCEVCGYVAEGEPPERCPVCRAAREQFTVID